MRQTISDDSIVFIECYSSIHRTKVDKKDVVHYSILFQRYFALRSKETLLNLDY